MLRALRFAAAVAAGYAAMVILITLVQETWLGGVGWGSSSPAALAAGGAGTFLAGMIGGFLATWIAAGHGHGPGLVMCAVVAVETSVLLASGKLAGPLWFDLAAAASLVVAILLGVRLCRCWHERRPRLRMA